MRALHYFDEIGLLKPSERSAAGHRLYSDDEVRRLYRILALRDLGMPLADIATSLDSAGDNLQSSVERQLDHVSQRIAALERLRQRLVTLVNTLRQAQDLSIDQLIETIEAMTQVKYFTSEQLTRLKQRHREVGAETFNRWRQRWSELNEEARRQLASGTNPADPAAQALARRWAHLMDDMTGGDRHILSSMYAKLDGKGPEAATLGAVTADAWNYIKMALAWASARTREHPLVDVPE